MERDERRELIGTLRSLSERAHASSVFSSRGRILCIWRAALLARRRRKLEWTRAEDVLESVHRAEQAALLREAVDIRIALCREGRLFTAPADPPRLEAWLERCAQEIECAFAAKLSVPAELCACCLFEPCAWPSASELARAALALEVGAQAQLALARASWIAGRPSEAERDYRALIASAEEPSVVAQAWEALGCSCEHRGENRAALAQFERAAAHGAGMRAEISSLGLALILGARDSARWAAARLEGRALAFPRAVRLAREVRARWELEGCDVARAGEAGDSELLRALLRSGGTPVSEVCTELFCSMGALRC